MRHVEVSAQRIRQRVHRRHRRIGKRHARQQRPFQHGAPRIEVVTVFQHSSQIVRQQRQRARCETVGQQILLVPRRIRLDCVHHGVDAGHRRHPMRESERERGVEYSEIWIQQTRHHAFLFGARRGDDRDGRDLRSRTGRRWHLYERQSGPLCEVHAINRIEAFVRADEQRHQLGRIERTPTANPDHPVDLCLACACHRDVHARLGWIRLHTVEDDRGHGRSRERRQHVVQDPTPAQPRIRDHKRAVHTQRRRVRGETCCGPIRADNAARRFKLKAGHRRASPETVYRLTTG